MRNNGPSAGRDPEELVERIGDSLTDLSEVHGLELGPVLELLHGVPLEEVISALTEDGDGSES